MNTLEKVRKPVHNKCFGIEIECVLPAAVGVPARNTGYHRFFFAGIDGSINVSWRDPVVGVEFVSQPLPFNMLNKEIDWLGKKFGSWTVNDSCGIHVHVSRKMVSEKRLESLFTAIGNNYVLLHNLRDLFGRAPNEYCSWSKHAGRYSAINFHNPNTIEFRMFKSGDAAWAKECVRRTKLMCEFKGKPTYEALLELFTKPEV